MQNKNEYKGFSLFNDIADVELKNRNRAVILCNIIESNLDKKTKKINMRGHDLVVNYFNLIPEHNRLDVSEKFKQQMLERGFKL